MKTIFLAAAVFGVCGMLSACGGGGGGGGMPGIQMPIPGDETTPPADGTTPPADGTPPQAMPIFLNWDTPEFDAVHWPLSVVNAEYAYEQGFHGQGVTIVNHEEMLASHQDLQENVLTMDIGLDCTGFVYGVDPRDQMRKAARDMYGCDPFAEKTSVALVEIGGVPPDEVVFLHYHGTAVGGILAAARNGEGGHGVAPLAKMIPIPHITDFLRSNDVSPLQWIIDNEIPIVNHSFNLGGVAYDHQIVPYYSMFKDADTVLVWAAQNNAPVTIWDEQHAMNNQIYLPADVPEMEDNWLVVAALDQNLDPLPISCGVLMRWCISAPQWLGAFPAGPRTDEWLYEGFGQTSAATPIVSGALAVLRSAAPELPMAMIRQILLESATPLGARIDNPEVQDEVYGWGLVNISAAMVSIKAIQTPDGTMLSDLRRSLPPEFSHLRGRLSEVSVALRITDRSYYNIPLSDVVGGGGDLPQTPMGDAAKEMLSPDYDAGESFRFWGGADYSGGGSRFIAANDSPFGAASSEDVGGYVRWTTADYGGMSAFGEYQRTEIDADYGANSLISEVRGAYADGWTMGMQFADVWRFGDKFRLSARQESRISGGEMVMRYPVAEGDSHLAFIGESEQTIRTETARIPLKNRPETIWAAGYSQKTDGYEWSAAAEWNSSTNAKALSAEFVIRL